MIGKVLVIITGELGQWECSLVGFQLVISQLESDFEFLGMDIITETRKAG